MISTPFKAGFVALGGRPNAGKSTLLNALLDFKLSIVSPKPQTTRHKILGILNGPDCQICFLDNPGYLAKPNDPLQENLRRVARGAWKDENDLIVWLIEPDTLPGELPEDLLPGARSTPLILVLNKIDLPEAQRVQESLIKAFQDLLKPEAFIRISALKKTGTKELLAEIIGRLPESPPYYDPGEMSDRWERFFAGEFIREKVFELFQQEIPHATAVVIEQFREESGRKDHILATLFVEKESQKPIILGRNGQAIRLLTQKSQQAIEAFLGRPVELEIWVKERKNWRKDPRALKEFGYL